MGPLLTKARRVLGLRMEGRPAPTESSCEYTEKATADKRQGVVLQFDGWKLPKIHMSLALE
jgi:hypothetical protein